MVLSAILMQVMMQNHSGLDVHRCHQSSLDSSVLGGEISRRSLEFCGILEQHLRWLWGFPQGEVPRGSERGHVMGLLEANKNLLCIVGIFSALYSE